MLRPGVHVDKGIQAVNKFELDRKMAQWDTPSPTSRKKASEQEDKARREAKALALREAKAASYLNKPHQPSRACNSDCSERPGAVSVVPPRLSPEDELLQKRLDAYSSETPVKAQQRREADRGETFPKSSMRVFPILLLTRFVSRPPLFFCLSRLET